MQERSFWLSWAHILQRWGLREPVAALLEAGGPLSLLLAQIVYLGQPLLSGSSSAGAWQALAEMLEDPLQTRSFAAFLREEEVA